MQAATYDGSIRIARSAIEAMGVSRSEADKMMREFEAGDRQIMLETAVLHDAEVSLAETKAAIEKIIEKRGKWEAQLQGRMDAARKNIETDALEEDDR